MNYDLFIADGALSYGNSLLYPSGLVIAQIKCDGDWVSLETAGQVCIIYNGEKYKNVSDFPQELVDIIKSNKINDYINSGEIEIIENNWWEFVYSNGDGVVCDCDPKDYNTKSELARDLFENFENLLFIG